MRRTDFVLRAVQHHAPCLRYTFPVLVHIEIEDLEVSLRQERLMKSNEYYWSNRRPAKILSIAFLFALFLFSTMKAQKKYLRVMTFNVENLFDTIHDEGKEDYEFLPEGALEWTEQRFNRKLFNLAEVISDAGEREWPAFVGLVEVENAHVMDELLKRTILGRVGYKYIISESDDIRGIDVALLYLPDLFQLRESCEWSADFPNHPHKKSRNILHLSGQLFNGESLHLMVVHLPSRREGKKKSDPLRRSVISLLQSKCDSIMNADSTANILVMGDFNCEPQDPVSRGWAHLLTARRHNYKKHLMYDLTSRIAPGAIPGSYYFRGIWEQIDRIVANGNLLRIKEGDGKLTYKWRSARSLMIKRWMRRSEDGRYFPRRTYGGTQYIGGVSDHLPVVADFFIPINGKPNREELR